MALLLRRLGYTVPGSNCKGLFPKKTGNSPFFILFFDKMGLSGKYLFKIINKMTV